MPLASLPVWSDGSFCVLFHPITGSTFLMSPWAVIALNLVSDGLTNAQELIGELSNLAIEDGQAAERVFFVDLLNELIRLDYLLEKPGN